ncbi:MAG: class B sortase [Eubacteriales bacterium]
MKSRTKWRSPLLIALFCVFAAVFVFSAVMLIRSVMEFVNENREHESLENEFLIFDTSSYIQTSGTAPETSSAVTEAVTGKHHAIVPGWATNASGVLTETSAEASGTAEPPVSTEAPAGNKPLWPEFSVNWETLSARNPDVIGWIWMYDSDISYPVLLGDSNDEYLYSTIDGEYARFGSIFADYRVNGDFTSRNTIIYGHNGGYGVKFGGLMNFRSQSYYEGHRYICILTPSGLMKYCIYSAYVTTTSGIAYQMSFGGDADFEAFLKETAAASEIVTGVVPGTSNRILTLSTCTNAAENERMVIHAVLEN